MKRICIFLTVLLLGAFCLQANAEQLFRAKANGPSGSITCYNDEYSVTVNLSSAGTTPELTNVYFQVRDQVTEYHLGYGHGYISDKAFQGTINSGLKMDFNISDVDWQYITGSVNNISVEFMPFDIPDYSYYGFKEKIAGTTEVESRYTITTTSGIRTQMYTEGRVIVDGVIEISNDNAYCHSYVSDNRGVRIAIENKKDFYNQ